MSLSRLLAVSGTIATITLALFAGCSSDKAVPMTTAEAGKESLPPIMADNPGSERAAAGSGPIQAPTVVGPAGTGGSSGSGGQPMPAAGSGGQVPVAGSSGSAGASGASGAGGQAGAADDPFAGLLPPTQVSCEGLLCLEAQDCANLYPTENATCKFTKCVDLSCQ